MLKRKYQSLLIVVIITFFISGLFAQTDLRREVTSLQKGITESVRGENVYTPYPTELALLYDNGPLITHPGQGFGGADASAIQSSLGMTVFGSGMSIASGFSVADDITNDQAWSIEEIHLFTYQTGSTTTSTINDVRLQIWNGRPDKCGTLIYGDLTTNVLSSTNFTNIYRVTSTTLTNNQRPVMRVVVQFSPAITLQPGNYWFQWQMGGTLASGPWQPPVTILGSTTTGNALQFDGTTSTWNPIVDVGQQGLPFQIFGVPAATIGPGLASNPTPANYATNIGAPNTTLSWTNPSGTIATQVFFGTCGSLTQIYSGAPITNLNVGSLAFSTDYYWRVISVGDEGNTQGVLWNFKTADDCPTVVAPFIENFEGAAFPPDCWTRTSTPQLWIRGTASGYGTDTSSARADFYNVSSGQADLITVQFNSSGLTTPVLVFDHAYATYQTEVDSLTIYYSTNNGTSWNLLQAFAGGLTGPLNTAGAVTASFVPNASQWATKTIVLPAGTNKLKFTARTAYGNNLYIDNVSVQQAPSCVAPTNLNATGITTNSAILSWTENGSATAWDIEYGATPFTPTGVPSISGVTNPYTLLNLNHSTQYAYYVRSSCGGGNFSSWAGPFNFTTGCAAFTPPYSQSFDQSTFPPLCWTRINAGTGNNWLRAVSGTFSGAGAMVYVFDSLNAANAWMITSEMTLLSTKTYIVTFYQRVASSLYPEKMKVTVGTAPNVAAQTTTIWDNAGGTELTNPFYELRFAQFTPPVTGSYYFGFNAYSDADQFALYVDEIRIYELPPVDLAITYFYQSSGFPIPRPGEKSDDYRVIFEMNKQSGIEENLITLFEQADGVKSTEDNRTVLIENINAGPGTELLNNIDLTAEVSNIGANSASYSLNWNIDGAAQTPFIGPSINSLTSNTTVFSHTPANRGTFYVTSNIVVTGDANPDNNIPFPFRMRVYPDSYTRTIYDRGDNIIDNYVGWGATTIQMKAGVRYTAGADIKLAGVDFICRTETVISGEIIIQIRSEGSGPGSPGAVLYTQVYSGSGYLAPGSLGDYIHFAFGDDAPTIAAGSDYWITIKMPLGVTFPGAVHNDGFTPGRSFYESNTDSTVWNPLVVTTERAWIMRSVEVPVGGATFQLSVAIANGWNMVAVPGLHPVDQNVNTWWAGKDPAAGVFRFAGGYQAVTTVAPGTGYWMKHVGANTYNTGDEWPAGGIQIVPNDPIPAVTGWNLIGGYHNTVATAGITTTPVGLISGQVFGYTPGSGYAAVTNLVPGYGYWIKLTGAGNINLPSSLAKSAPVSEYIKSDWGRIILTDAAGKSYTLYSVNGEIDLTQYELPPLPPAGMFDVRYGSQRLAEVIGSEIQTIEMQGIEYPVTVRVEGMTIRLQDETGKIVNQVIKSGEDVVISNPQVGKLKVSGNVIPETYSLEQNYPNPFNPSTTIEFSIPEDVENVKLTIYDALGQKVAELVNGKLEAGRYSYQWDASKLASGLYIYQLQTSKFTSTKKMLMLK